MPISIENELRLYDLRAEIIRYTRKNAEYTSKMAVELELLEQVTYM